MKPVLRMQGICKRFPGVTALDSVDLEAFPAEVVALIGENGAGKSTLMKIIGGIHAPDAGTIEIDGLPATIRSVRDAARYGIAFIHQELQLLDNLDIASNIFLGREKVWGGPLRLIDRKKIEAETETQLDRVGLKVSPRTLVGRLSLAQQQLVEIAKSLTWSARLLIMDEPTSSLTSVETERLFTVVADLRSRGVSIVYISHRLREIERIADRVVALCDGRNSGSLSRSEIQHDNMVRLMRPRGFPGAKAPGLQGSGQYAMALDSSPGASAPGTLPVCLDVRKIRTRRFPAHELSFSVRRGEILGLAGLVGSGRTELARALFGIERPVSGDILIDGVPARIQSARDAINEGLFLAPEDRRASGLVVQMSVRENVTLPGLRSYSRSGIIQKSRERAVAEKGRVELNIKTPSIETPVANLSGGNQQKVVLAKWLAMKPKIILFDEPTRGIDVTAKAEIYRLMRELASRGVAIVMISSDMEEILENSDRIAVMHDGRITGILDRAGCTEEAVMRLAVAG
jgi:ribose transport system ATP-binding protein